MNKTILIIFMAVCLVLMGCSKEPFCKSPSIEYQKGSCCLDSNSNNICDINETVVQAQPETNATETQQTVVQAQPETNTTETPQPVQSSVQSATMKPEENRLCPINYTIIYVPGACKIKNDSVTFALRGLGSAGINGAWLYTTDTNGNTSYWKDTASGAKNTNVIFNVPAKNVMKMLALPIKDSTACLNQRVYVINNEVCINLKS